MAYAHTHVHTAYAHAYAYTHSHTHKHTHTHMHTMLVVSVLRIPAVEHVLANELFSQNIAVLTRRKCSKKAEMNGCCIRSNDHIGNSKFCPHNAFHSFKSIG